MWSFKSCTRTDYWVLNYHRSGQLLRRKTNEMSIECPSTSCNIWHTERKCFQIVLIQKNISTSELYRNWQPVLIPASTVSHRNFALVVDAGMSLNITRVTSRGDVCVSSRVHLYNASPRLLNIKEGNARSMSMNIINGKSTLFVICFKQHLLKVTAVWRVSATNLYRLHKAVIALLVSLYHKCHYIKIKCGLLLTSALNLRIIIYNFRQIKKFSPWSTYKDIVSRNIDAIIVH